MGYKMNKQSIYSYATEKDRIIKDRYDFESINRELIKRIVKKFNLSGVAYVTGLMKSYCWPENIRMICETAMSLSLDEDFEKFFGILKQQSCENGGWGLPVVWHSGKYVFPEKTMMSTTTAEIADCYYKWYTVGKCSLEEHRNTIQCLRNNLQTSYSDDDMLILSYTPCDKYKVINSNLLVASALSKDVDDRYDKDVLKILHGVKNAVGSTGKFTYFYDGGRVDSYHQAFCIRALYDMREKYKVANQMFEEGLKYLIEDLMDSKGRVYLTPEKNMIDLHGVADTLVLFKIINDNYMYKKVFEAGMDALYKNDVLFQYANGAKEKKLKAFCPAFGRQGYLRMMLAID